MGQRHPIEHVSAAGISERRYGPSTLPHALPNWLREPHDLSACQDPAQVRDGIDAALDWLAMPDALPAA